MIRSKSGQAMFEFIIFLPFVIVLFKMFLNIGGAINGSINQQKALRSYYYFTLKNSSYYPSLAQLNSFSAFQSVGFYALGFAEDLISEKPVAPCYKLEPFFGEDIDECLKRPKNNESQFIKPKTMYGLCGPQYVRQSSQWQMAFTTPGSCTTR